MLKGRIILYALLGLILSAGSSQASRIDSLMHQFNRAKDDTTRISICINLSQEFENTNPDSAFFWLNQGLKYSSNCSTVVKDSTLCYYHAVVISSLARLYAILSRDLDKAEIYADSGIAVFNRLVDKKPGKFLHKKINKALSVNYGILGRIHYTRGDLLSATTYFTLAIDRLDLSEDKNSVARMYNNLGVLHRLQTNYAQSLYYYQKAYDLFQDGSDSISIAGVLANIGTVSKDIGSYEKSLENYLKALSIYENSNHLSYIASTLTNIGSILVESRNTKESIPYFKRALGIYNTLKDFKGLAGNYLSLGISYRELQQYDSSYYYLFEAQKVYKEIGDKVGWSNAYLELGEFYYIHKSYNVALKTFETSYRIAKDIGLNTAQLKNSIAKTYFNTNEVSLAQKWALEALDESKSAGLIAVQKDVHSNLVSIFEKQKRYDKALEHFRAFFTLYDSVLSRDRSHKFAEMETLYQLEQKQRVISQLEKEKAFKEVELKDAEIRIRWQKLHSLMTMGVLVFLLIILFLLYRQFKIKRLSNQKLSHQFAEIQQKNEEIISQKEEIESQRNEMERQKESLREKSEQLERFNWILMDSIDYASNIQLALLPSGSIFQSFFSDHFLILYPKDVVSGDFYWAYPKDDSIIIAVADCTGHGVPGGFMSMMGISALNELMGRGIVEPSDILNNLRLLIIESLKQTGKVGEQQDGLDISIISYTKGNSYIDFAGANHGLWLVREDRDFGRYELHELKGDKMPVSFYYKMKPFETKRMPIISGDQLYLFTDGYRHQLGGEEFARKFGRDNFKKLILNNAYREMDSQKNIIEDNFFRWIGDNDQLDDITIIGLKV